MARQVIQLAPFSKGLNTEINNLSEAPEYTTDELNTIIRKDGTRTRRLGIDYEEGYKFSDFLVEDTNNDFAYQACEWNDIDGDKNVNYIVIQAGGTLLFYKNEGVPFSSQESEFTLDMAPYKLEANDDYKKVPVSFNTAYGSLFVTSPAIQPFRLQTIEKTDDSNPAPEDILPSAKVSCKVYVSKKGRGAGNGSVQFYINGVAVGSKWTIQEHYGRSGNCSDGPWMPYSNVYAEHFNAIPENERRGITAVPYRSGEPDRWSEADDFITFTAPADSGLSTQGLKISLEMSYLHQTRSTSDWVTFKNEGYMVGGRAYKKVQSFSLKVRDLTGVEDYLDMAAIPEKISYSKLYNLLNQGWTVKLLGDFYKAQVGGYSCFPSNNLAQQYLKDSQTSAFKPTALLDTTFGNTPAPKGHFVLDYFNQQRVDASMLEVQMQNLAAACGKQVSEILDEQYVGDALTQVPDKSPRYKYVTDSCAYAGRMFYLAGDVLLYSMVLAEDLTRAGLCYQEADPTSEEISDLLPTDGGMLPIEEIGNGQKVFNEGSYLIAVGDRGLMAFGGTANNIFTATAYSARSLPTLTTRSPHSFVSTEFGTLYWGDVGIISCADTAEGLLLDNITTATIQKFYNKIPNEAREKCKGVYDKINKEVWWFYPSSNHGLDRALVFNLDNKTFTPLAFSSNEDAAVFVPRIVAPVQLKVAYKSYKKAPLYAYYEPTEKVDYSKMVWTVSDKAGREDLPDIVYTHSPWGKYSALEEAQYYYRDETLTDSTGIKINPPTLLIHGFKPYYGICDRLSEDADTPVVYSCQVTTRGQDEPMRLYSSLEDVLDYTQGREITGQEGFLFTDITMKIPFTSSGFVTTKMDLGPSGGKLEESSKIPVKYYIAKDPSDLYGTKRIIDQDGNTIDVDEPVEGLGESYESFSIICHDGSQMKLTFADITNLNCKDWDKADVKGSGFNYVSYIQGHPVNLGDINRKKTIPYLLTTFRRTEKGITKAGDKVFPSNCNASVKWSWSTSSDSGDWDLAQKVYRPDKEYLDREFVDTKTRVRGGGKAFAVRLESVSNYNFIIEAIGIDVYGDSRI